MRRADPFHYTFTVRLHDTDVAGVLFYGHLFRHAHDAYEAFMADLGFSLDRLISEGSLRLPIVHAEADFLQAICHGDRLQTSVVVAELGRSAFTMAYSLRDAAGVERARLRTVHANIAPNGTGSMPLPTALRNALAGRLAED